MHVLVDANLPRTVAQLLAALGYQVSFARDIGLGAAPDEEIAAYARRHGAMLVTRDIDFADVRRYPPHEYSGIVVLRLVEPATANEIANVLERFVQQSGLVRALKGRLAIVENDRVRFRPPLA